MNKYDEVIVECSPLIRTMMTAAHTAKALGLSQVVINNRFMEWMGSNYYTKNPMTTIELKIKKKEQIVSEFLDGIDFIDTDDYLHEISMSFPENGY